MSDGKIKPFKNGDKKNERKTGNQRWISIYFYQIVDDTSVIEYSSTRDDQLTRIESTHIIQIDHAFHLLDKGSD